MPVPDQVEIDQVDRGPRDQQVEQEEDEVVVAGEERGLVGDGADHADRDEHRRDHDAGPGPGQPPFVERLAHGDRAEHAAVGVDGVGVDDADHEHDHDQPAEIAGEPVDLGDQVGAGGYQADQRADHHRRGAAQYDPGVGVPEHRPYALVG